MKLRIIGQNGWLLLLGAAVSGCGTSAAFTAPKAAAQIPAVPQGLPAVTTLDALSNRVALITTARHLWKTKDGGQHWTATHLPSVDAVDQLDFLTPTVGWMTGWFRT